MTEEQKNFIKEIAKQEKQFASTYKGEYFETTADSVLDMFSKMLKAIKEGKTVYYFFDEN